MRITVNLENIDTKSRPRYRDIFTKRKGRKIKNSRLGFFVISPKSQHMDGIKVGVKVSDQAWIS